jgi:lambda family phage portal protein
MDKNQVSILDASGRPFAPRKASMLSSNGRAPYDAADIYGQTMADWRPYLWSPDGELNMYRDRIVSRVRDLVRNDGWASGAVTRTLDNAIGANFRPIAKPDYRALAAYTGNKAFDAKWADEFGRVVEANWRTWSNDPNRYCDAQRNLTVAQVMRLAFRHKIVDGDALAQLLWLPERVGLGRARYCTTIQVIDPDRLSNPQLRFDQMTMRGGVEVDELGAAVAYHIRRAHAGDWFSAAKAVHWDKIPRETEWGRPIIVHDFDHDRAGQHRGGAGILAPVVQRMKMLIRYDGAELDAAIINAIFGAYIESPFDAQFVEQALGGGDELSTYQQGRADFHDERRIKLGDARMPILYPGEKITSVNAARPASNFGDFEGAVLRNVSGATGLSAQQISNNWSDVNYSSARGALLEAWKTLNRRRIDFGHGFGQPIWCAHMEEQFEVDNLPLPNGAPDFIECRTAYAAAKWMGPGRGWIDIVKERQGAVLGMDSGLSTLEQECADNSGEDWEENLDQRKRELEAYLERGLKPPTWAGMQTATEVIQPQEAI